MFKNLLKKDLIENHPYLEDGEENLNISKKKNIMITV